MRVELRVIALAVLLALAVFLIWLLIFSPGPEQKDTVLPVIVISPGHGWLAGDGNIDTGASSEELVEKDINLDVAKQTRELLQRCPVSVHLTREADAPEHTLDDVAEIVNALGPVVAISIHADSDEGNRSGTEAWHTVGGHDDDGSLRLATLLADDIAAHLDIANEGIKPESLSRQGALYIHDWGAPSALIELAYLQGDAQLLREQRRDFARSVARSALTFIGLPANCADHAGAEGTAIAAYFPGETKTNAIRLFNDGLANWQPGKYALVNVENRLGAAERFSLSQEIVPGESATWNIPATAPATPGINQQVWQIEREGESVTENYRVYLIVVPEEAQDLRASFEEQIDAWREQGEQELDGLVEELSQEMAAQVEERAEEQLTQCLGSNALFAGLLIAVALVPVFRRRS